MSRDKLSYCIQIRYGTGNGEPTSTQLEQIVTYLANLGGSTPSAKDWGDAVYRFCPSAGKYRYDGLDNSDINALLIAAMKK